MPGWDKDHKSTKQAHAEYAELKRAHEAQVLAKIEKYARAGDETAAIAARLGVSLEKVRRVRKRLGLAVQRTPLCTLPNGVP